MNASFQKFWEQSFFKFFKKSCLLIVQSSLNFSLITWWLKSLILSSIILLSYMGQVLLSSLTNTVSPGKLFLNFRSLRNISPDFFCVYLFVRDKHFSESIYVILSLFYYSSTYNPGGEGHLNVTWRGGAHFLRVSTTHLGKKFAFWYPVSEFLDYKTIGNNSLLFLKTIAFYSWTNSHNPFRNFWSIFIPRSGIYAEKWYPEKRHLPYRFIWKYPPSGL